MLSYRCVLTETKPQERPVQAFFTNRAVASDWASVALSRAGEGAEVSLYEVKEVLISKLKWPNKAKPKTESKEEKTETCL
jgi:hypothetical protein